MSFFITLRAEMLKTKRSASMYLTIVAAAFGPFMSLLDLLLGDMDKDHQNELLNDLFTAKFQIAGGMLLPFFIMLTCTLLPQIEYRNNTWKQVFTSPQSKTSIYLAKFLNVQALIILFLVMNLVFMFIAAAIVNVVYPSLQLFSQQLHWNDIIAARVNSYVALLAMCALQFWMGIRFRNFIVPLAIGIALWFVGLILVIQVKSGVAEYFPYSFSVFANFKEFSAPLDQALVTSVIYTVVFLALGCVDMIRQEKRKIA